MRSRRIVVRRGTRWPASLVTLAVFVAAVCSTAPITEVSAAGSAGAPQVRVNSHYPHGYIEFTAASGAVLNASVSVGDGGNVSATFLITGVDGYTSPASGVVYGTRQTPLRDGPTGNGEFGAGTWITLDRSQVSLNPGQYVDVNATIRVPLGTHAGDWVGGIMSENPTPAGTSSGGGAALAVKEATGIAVVVHVPGNASPGAIFLDRPSVRVVGTQQLLDIPLRYTGDVLVKPLFSFQIKDSTGRVVYQHSGRFDTFVPHTTIVYEILLTNVLSPGDYTFTGTAGPDGNQQTFSYPIHVKNAPPRSSSPGSGAQPGSPAQSSGLPAWLWIPILMVPVLLFFFLLLAVRRRCTHCGRPRPWGLMTVGDYQEISHCPECRAVARERRKVSLCPTCYRSHVLPIAKETVTAV
jgi:hypothetical protein